MSTRKRKLSFLGFGTGSPQTDADGEEIVHLDDEMEKLFQREPALEVRRLTANTEPQRDPDPGRSANSNDTADTDTSIKPQVSERVPSRVSLDDQHHDSPGYKHVQFTPKRSEDDLSDDETEDSNDRNLKMKTQPPPGNTIRHHHQKARTYSLPENPRRVSMQPEDETLAEVDMEELDSHRSDDPKALRRSKYLQPKISSDGNTGLPPRKEERENLLKNNGSSKTFDRSPNSVFVQLDELFTTGEEQEWKETARWIKYEEHVEEGSDRWGKPHVASLSFHSLLNLRRCLETGVVLMDLEEKDLPGIAYRVVEQMVIDGLIEEDDKPVVMRSLLLRHRHVNDNERGFRFSISGRKHSSYTSLQNVSSFRRQSTTPADTNTAKTPRRTSDAAQAKSRRISDAGKSRRISDAGGRFRRISDALRIDIKEETYTASQEELKRLEKDTILKRIPEGAEATTVLVGAVGFLDQPTIAFVRLAQGVVMPGITEVPIPVRFMFILLGPSTSDLDYHEVGRSISTLMSNPSFHKIAYKADDRKDLLSAINEFLDDSIVLPPGDWERQALLPFDELKAKSEKIRRRKQDALEKKQAAAIAAGVISTITTADETKKALLAAEDSPPPPNPLDKTGRLFGGLIRDVKRRYPLYKSDITDALNGQCLAATIFMYFASLSGAIAFGGMLSEKTGGNVGISETLVFTSISGILFALLGGQPLMNIGTTGPLLLFDASLYTFCESFNFDFLAARMCMGVWILIIALAVAAAEGSVLVKKFTRFTEDIFAALISIIFMAEAITKMISVFYKHPIVSKDDYCLIPENNVSLHNTTNGNETISGAVPNNIGEPNTALFCTMLTLGTFTIAYYLRIFRNGKFLGRSVRRALGDFGVPIAIILMVVVANLVNQVYTDKLTVPEGVQPTLTGRSWLVFMYEGINNFPFWGFFAMIIPASMVYIITFMETHIAELIIDKPERNMKKGSGFHLDIVIVSFINMFGAMFGAPWMCVATVRSVSHVSALTVMSTTHAPGEKPFVAEVKEQRLTGFLVAFLVGISVLMSDLLRMVPVSVLFGVFLYMGISSINGIQFFERSFLLFKPVKHHPQVPYVRRVPTLKMHLFTLIQGFCLIMLFVIKGSPISLVFPFFLILMIPLRWLLEKVFTPLELRALDGKQPELDMDDEPDFYQQANMG